MEGEKGLIQSMECLGVATAQLNACAAILIREVDHKNEALISEARDLASKCGTLMLAIGAVVMNMNVKGDVTKLH